MTTEAPHQTKELLLRAAEQLFAERGYDAVSTREIADAAGVNLGAIQYHFGTKGQLFIETVRAIMIRTGSNFDELEKRELPRTRFEAGVRLCEFVRAFLSQLADNSEPQGCRMMTREALSGHNNKDGMLDALVTAVVEDFWRPFFGSFSKVVAILNPKASEFQVKLCTDSIISQCVGYLVHRPFMERLLKIKLNDPQVIQILENHISSFSLRALGADEQFVTSVLDAAKRSGS